MCVCIWALGVRYVQLSLSTRQLLIVQALSSSAFLCSLSTPSCHPLSALEWPTRLLFILFFGCDVGVQLCLWQQAWNPQHHSPNEPTMAFQSYPILLHSSKFCQHFLHQTLSSVTSSSAFIAPCSLESPSSATPATCPRLPLASFCSLSAWINVKNQRGRAETEKDGEVCPVAMGYPGLGAALLELCKRRFFRAQLMSPIHYQLMRHLSKWSCVSL